MAIVKIVNVDYNRYDRFFLTFQHDAVYIT